jgi:glycosyltransferase involved in cell wall biosynthesis
MNNGLPDLISVIIPTFNRAHYVTGAVQSALAQRDVAVEIIVVDDGSTDDTRARLAPYVDRDQVRYIDQPNAGAGAARNAGLRAARGEYVAFLDADDLWEPFKLSLQLAYLDQHPDVALVSTDFSGFTDHETLADSYIATFCYIVWLRGRRFETIYPLQEQFAWAGALIPAFSGDVFEAALEGYFTLTSTVMARRTCLETIGLFPEDTPTSEDWICYVRLARRYPFAYLDLPTAHYRVGHPDQLSGPVYRPIAAGLQLATVESVKRADAEYYCAHRAQVDRIIRFHRWTLAYRLFDAGDYEAAARVYLESIRDFPLQKRAYFYLMLAWWRSLKPSRWAGLSARAGARGRGHPLRR